jgi:colanic acid/amylovoran biosynthesis glycosyltransferase
MTSNSTKRRVALFRNRFLPYSETFIHDQIRHHERYEVTVMARRRVNADRFPGHRVAAVEEIPGGRRPLASAWYGMTARSKRIEEAMRRGGFHIAHAHFAHNGVFAMRYTRQLGMPLVVSLHGRDVTILMGRDKYRPAWWFYLKHYRRLFDETALFLAASSELKDLLAGLGCPEDKIVVHRLGIDLTRFAYVKKPEKPKSPLIVMAGRFVEKKGHAFGIEAAAEAAGRGCRFKLLIVGDGPLEAQYRSLIEKHGLGNRTEMPGTLPHERMAEILGRASVFLAPSVVAGNLDRDSGLIVAKEASACGVPVIGTLHGGIPDIIDDGVTGYLVPERDVKSLAGRLVSLLNSPEKCKAMGRAARQKMEKDYDIRKTVRALEKIYDSLLQEY